MLEKEFNPYEQALELREIGFNEGCIAFYNGKSLDWMIDDDNGLSYPTINPKKDVGECVKAPLYQQIFDWFRNKKGLLSCVGFEFTDRMGAGAYSFYYVIEHSTNEAFGWEQDGFSTFEEARLECLKKLIEIVKNEIK